MNKYYNIAFATAFGLLNTNAIAGEYSIGTGSEYTEGDYGTENDTSALYIPLTMGYLDETYGWSLTIPYLSVTGTGDVVYSRTGVRQPTQPTRQINTTSTTTSSTGPGSGSTTTTSKVKTESGLGDITLRGTYRPLPGGEDKTSLSVTAKVKFATADESKGLGTGENDYAVQLELARNMLYGYVGHMWIGDTAVTDYNNIVYGAVGVTAPAGRWDIGGEYYTEQEVLDGIDPVSEISLSAGRDVGKDYWLKLYLIKGFTDSTPDWGGGIGITRYF